MSIFHEFYLLALVILLRCLMLHMRLLKTCKHEASTHTHTHTFVYPYLCRNKHFMNCNSLHEAPEDTRNSLTSHTRLCLQGRPCKERWRRDGEMNVCSPAGECGGNDGQLGDQEVSTWVSLALCAVHIDTIKPPQSLWCRWLWRRCFEVAKVCWVMFILLPATSDICVWLCIRIKLL